MNKEYSNLLTYAQYAKLKSISLKTVYNHIKAGLIKPVIIGKAKFIKNDKTS